MVFYATKDRQGLEYLLEQSAKEAKGGGRHSGQGGGEGGGGIFGPDPRAQLETFGHVVEMCLTPGCRRAAVLSFFDEAAPAGRVRCCDACDAPAAVAEAVRKAQRVGLERRQRFAGGKHRLDFGGGSGGGGTRMEFERHPGEGLEYDGEGHSHALQESEEEGSHEPSASAREAAAAAAKRARAEGRSVVGALARAEAAAAQGGGGGSKARLLAKLDQQEGAPMATLRRVTSTAEVSPELRARVAAQLASALAGNVALAPALTAAGLDAAAAATAVEEACFGGAATKAAYQQAAASALVRARSAADLHKLPALGGAGGQAEERSVAGGLQAPAPGAEQPLSPEQQLMHRVAAAEQAAAAAAAGGPGAAKLATQAVELLHSLRNATVSVTLLQTTGAGKRLARLKKSSSEGVAAAAAEVVRTWKAAVVGS